MIADDLSRIAMSSNLSVTLARGADFARQQGHYEVTLEHMLLSLCEDPDAGLVLAASNIDLDRLRAEVMNYLASREQMPQGQAGTPAVSADLRRILDAAAAAARGGRRREINGAIVLAAIVGDGKSPAAHLLRDQGLTFEGAIRALQRAPKAPTQGTPHGRSGANAEDILADARARVQSRTAPPRQPVHEEELEEEPEAEQEPAPEPPMPQLEEREEAAPPPPQPPEPPQQRPEPRTEPPRQRLSDRLQPPPAQRQPMFEPEPEPPYGEEGGISSLDDGAYRMEEEAGPPALPASAPFPPPLPVPEPSWMPPPADHMPPPPPSRGAHPRHRCRHRAGSGRHRRRCRCRGRARAWHPHHHRRQSRPGRIPASRLRMSGLEAGWVR